MSESNSEVISSSRSDLTKELPFYDQYFKTSLLNYPYPKWNLESPETFNLGLFRKPIGEKSQDYLDGLVCCAAVYLNYDQELINRNISVDSKHHQLNFDVYQINHLGIFSINPFESLPDLSKIQIRDQLIDFLLETTEQTSIPEDSELQYITLVPFYKQVCDPFSPFGVKDDSYAKVYYGSLDFFDGLFDGFSWLNYPVRRGKVLDLTNYRIIPFWGSHKSL